MASWLPRQGKSKGSASRYSKKSAHGRFQPHLESLEDRQLPSTFTVSNVADSGTGSLRQAILDSNNTPGLNTIQFAIGTGVQRIYLNSALPEITNSVVIDGTTQPGFAGAPMILLNGSNAGANANGLTIGAGNTTVKGLIIRSFSGNGIELDTNGGDVTSDNYIGTDYSGLIGYGNGQRGIYVNSSSGNTIGGTTAGSGNVIAGNGLSGIVLDNSSSQNTIEGNLIGTNSAGNATLGNGAAGIRIADQSSGNTIGGSAAGTRNVISGNGTSGIVLDTGTSNDIIEGNYIGTDSQGLAQIGNGQRGVYIDGSSSNTIGGNSAGDGNVISANGLSGIVMDNSSSLNTVAGNLIGTDATGTHALSNAASGVRIGNQSNNNTIGGTTAATMNVISGNAASGVVLDTGTTNNVVEGNHIGTGIKGVGIVSNGLRGIYIDGSSGNTIGGTTSGSGNVISGNELSGVVLDNGSSQNTVEGNLVGTNANGTGALGNRAVGVRIIGNSTNNIIGGSVSSDHNVISGNIASGVVIDAGSSANQVAGNDIGTDASGAQPLGNGFDGVSIAGGAVNNAIGVSAGNVIAYNSGAGVRVSGSNTTGNAIQGNSIFNNLGGGIANQNGAAASLPAPTIQSVTLGASTAVSGSVSEQPNAAYTLDFYANPSAGSSGYQGQIFLGSAAVQTNASGVAAFNTTLNSATTSNELITATVTDANGNTSPFSQAVGNAIV
jgi:titin